jgi:hypothetical protein
MAIPYLQSINLNQNELQNAVIQNLATDPGSPKPGQIWFNTVTNLYKYNDNGAIRTLPSLANKITDFAAPTTSLAMNSQTITGLGTPVNPTDAATKQYVDNSALGLDVKASVKVATTVAGTLATSFANGQTIDGIALITGDRILLKNQASGSDNGIYTVNATGAPTRSVDCNAAANYLTGAFVFVEEGTVNAGASYIVQTQGTITPGTTAVAWVQFSGGAAASANNLAGGATGSIVYQSGANGTTFLAGNTAATDQVVVSHGTGSAAQAPTLSNNPALSAANMTNFPTLNQNTTGTAAGLSTTLALGSGGTNATTAAGARTNLGATGKYSQTFGDGSTTSYVITHNLGTNDVHVMVYYVGTPYQIVQCEVQLTTINTITLVFAVAPATNTLRVVVIG